MAAKPFAARLAKEATSLPSWAKLLREELDSRAVHWHIRLQPSAQEAVVASVSFLTSYPFAAPEVRLANVDSSVGDLIKLPCISQWSPVCQVCDILIELAERLDLCRQAYARALMELQGLKTAAPPWLLYAGDLHVPAWLSEIDSAIAENTDLDSVCPPGCGKYLRHPSRTQNIEDVRTLPLAQQSVPVLGPWRLEVIIRAPEGSLYDHAEFRGIRLEVMIGLGFPLQSPRLSVFTHIQHILGATTMPFLFYQTLAQQYSSGCRGFLACLSHFRDYLYRPLPGLEESGLPHAPDVNGAHALEKWQDAAQGNFKRLERVAAYQPHRLHPALYEVGPAPSGLASWQAAGLANNLVQALKSDSVLPFVEEIAPQIFSFQMFTDAACDQVLSELENYQRIAEVHGWPIARPNSMNNHGVILNEIGLEPWVDAMQSDVLGPMAAQLYPLEGASLSRHHSFLVEYEPGADLGLDMHSDDSDVTFNICLGKEFSGAGLVFCGQMGSGDHRKMQLKYEHKKGYCVVHLGRHRHGADDIVEGQRRNLIIWNSNQNFRETQNFHGLRAPHYLDYSREEFPPDKICISRTYDRDAEDILKNGQPNQIVSASAWCPPAGKEFVAAC